MVVVDVEAQSNIYSPTLSQEGGGGHILLGTTFASISMMRVVPV